jgi:hypothetical protein
MHFLWHCPPQRKLDSNSSLSCIRSLLMFNSINLLPTLAVSQLWSSWHGIVNKNLRISPEDVKCCCYQDSCFLSSYKGLSMIRKINNCEHQTLHSGTLSFTLLLLICNCIPMMNPLLACPHFPSHLGVLVLILGIAAQGGTSSHIRVLTNLHALLSQEALVLSLQCLEDQFATKASLTNLG